MAPVAWARGGRRGRGQAARHPPRTVRMRIWTLVEALALALVLVPGRARPASAAAVRRAAGGGGDATGRPQTTRTSGPAMDEDVVGCRARHPSPSGHPCCRPEAADVKLVAKHVSSYALIPSSRFLASLPWWTDGLLMKEAEGWGNKSLGRDTSQLRSREDAALRVRRQASRRFGAPPHAHRGRARARLRRW